MRGTEERGGKEGEEERDCEIMYSISFHRANKKGSFGPVSVHAWYGSNAKVVIAIWKMARDQHKFYRSKRASRVRHQNTPDTTVS